LYVCIYIYIYIVCSQAAFQYILECLWLTRATHLFCYSASTTVLYCNTGSYLCKLCEAVSRDDQFAGENLKDFVLEGSCAFSCVFVFIVTERGNQRDFYHAIKDFLSALPQRISGTFYTTVMKSLITVKVNVSLCKPKMNVTDWSCISIHTSLRS
jgi:hypothetical protein